MVLLPLLLLPAFLRRHNTMASGMLLGGLACIGCAVTPSATGRAALAAVGKFGIAGSFAIASIYTRCDDMQVEGNSKHLMGDL